MKSMEWTGYFVIAIGVIHTLVGVIVPSFRKAIYDVMRLGYVNRVHPHMSRYAAMFFFIMGFWWIPLGHLMISFNCMQGTVPHYLGWYFIGLATVSVAAIPKSGFWAFYIPGICILLN